MRKIKTVTRSNGTAVFLPNGVPFFFSLVFYCTTAVLQKKFETLFCFLLYILALDQTLNICLKI